MIWQHEWIDWSLIGHILAFVDRSQHIWPTDSLFPERQNRIIPLKKKTMKQLEINFCTGKRWSLSKMAKDCINFNASLGILSWLQIATCDCKLAISCYYWHIVECVALWSVELSFNYLAQGWNPDWQNWEDSPPHDVFIRNWKLVIGHLGESSHLIVFHKKTVEQLS